MGTIAILEYDGICSSKMNPEWDEAGSHAGCLWNLK